MKTPQGKLKHVFYLYATSKKSGLYSSSVRVEATSAVLQHVLLVATARNAHVTNVSWVVNECMGEKHAAKEVEFMNLDPNTWSGYLHRRGPSALHSRQEFNLMTRQLPFQGKK